MAKDKTLHSAAIFASGCLLLIACGCNREPEAVLQQRLVGTWRYAGSEGNKAVISSDLTFTFAGDGSYASQMTIPQNHSVEGTAKIENGFLTIAVTKRDGTNVLPPIVEHQTIIRIDEKELLSKSEGSNVKNRFRNLRSTSDDGEDSQRID